MAVFKAILQTIVLAGSLANALPTPAHPTFTDLDILNYALSLEHLQNAFYTQALQNFTADDFKIAGYDESIFGRIKQISSREKIHVQLLEHVIGETAIKPCEYNFPVASFDNFPLMAVSLENVITAAYSGSIPLLTEPVFQEFGESIRFAEASHGTFPASVALGINPWPKALGSLLPPQAVLSLVAPYILSCPSTNAQLPFAPLPPLDVHIVSPSPAIVGLDFIIPAAEEGCPLWLVLVQGTTFRAVPISDKKAQLPDEVMHTRTAFGFVSTSVQFGSSTLEEVVAGPIMFNFPYGSEVDDSMSDYLPFKIPAQAFFDGDA